MVRLPVAGCRPPADTFTDRSRAAQPAGNVHVVLTDLDLLRVPSHVVAALEGADAAVIDGLIVRRDGRDIIVEGPNEPPWLR